MKSQVKYKPALLAVAIMSAFAFDASAETVIEDSTYLSDTGSADEDFLVTNRAVLTADRIVANTMAIGERNGSDLAKSGIAVINDSTINSVLVSYSELIGDNLQLNQLSLNNLSAVSLKGSTISSLLSVRDSEMTGRGLVLNNISVTEAGKVDILDSTINGSLQIHSGGRLDLRNVNKTDDYPEIRFGAGDGSRLDIHDSKLAASIVTLGTGGGGTSYIDLFGSTLLAGAVYQEAMLVKNGDSVRLEASFSSVIEGDIRAEQGGEAYVMLAQGSMLRGALTNVQTLDLTGKSALLALTADSDVGSLNMGNSQISTGGTVKFSANRDGDEAFHTLTAGSLTSATPGAGGHFIMRVDVARHEGDFLQVTGNAAGDHLLYVTNTGSEVGQHATLLPLVNIGSGDATFALADGKVDVGAWQYSLVRVGNTWGLMRPGDGVTIKPIEEEAGSGEETGSGEEIETPTTSPTTDAVLSLASALKEIYFGELRSLMARGNRVNSGLNDGVWGSYTSNHVNVEGAWNSAYKLNQNGFLLGADHQFSIGDDKLTAGVFVSQSNGGVKHARGGKSTIETWGTGLYASYDFNSGWYASAVAKVNRFDSSLSARMTDGVGVSGDWTTWGYGVGAEAGRHIVMENGLAVTPYASLNGYQNEAETARLSNGLKAEFGNSRSLRAEAGVRAEKAFSVGTATVTPYASAALMQELVRSSDVRINDSANFKNDFTGSGVKAAGGVSIEMGGNSRFWVEAATGSAEKTTMPVQASAGVRISF